MSVTGTLTLIHQTEVTRNRKTMTFRKTETNLNKCKNILRMWTVSPSHMNKMSIITSLILPFWIEKHPELVSSTDLILLNALRLFNSYFIFFYAVWMCFMVLVCRLHSSIICMLGRELRTENRKCKCLLTYITINVIHLKEELVIWHTA